MSAPKRLSERVYDLWLGEQDDAERVSAGVATLESRVERLEGLIRSVAFGDGGRKCPWCVGWNSEMRHTKDCPAYAAISPAPSRAVDEGAPRCYYDLQRGWTPPLCTDCASELGGLNSHARPGEECAGCREECTPSAALAGQPEAGKDHPTPDAVKGLVEALLVTAKRTVMSWTPSPLDGPCWCESDPDDEDKHGRPYNGGEHEEQCLKKRAALAALTKEKP